MGYRSDISIMCEKKAYDLLKEAWESFNFKPDEILKCNDYYIVYWEWVKWYPNFKDVSAIETVLEKLDSKIPNTGYGYKFVAVGEDGTEDYRYNEDGEEFGMYVSHDIIKPEGEWVKIE